MRTFAIVAALALSSSAYGQNQLHWCFTTVGRPPIIEVTREVPVIRDVPDVKATIRNSRTVQEPCQCSPACTCGCKSGKPCDCKVTRGTQASYPGDSISWPSPVAQPAIFYNTGAAPANAPLVPPPHEGRLSAPAFYFQPMRFASACST